MHYYKPDLLLFILNKIIFNKKASPFLKTLFANYLDTGD